MALLRSVTVDGKIDMDGLMTGLTSAQRTLRDAAIKRAEELFAQAGAGFSIRVGDLASRLSDDLKQVRHARASRLSRVCTLRGVQWRVTRCGACVHRTYLGK